MATPSPTDRSRLLSLLRQHGILYASPTQPVLSRDGSSARWMLDSLCVSLDPEGIVLAGRCLSALLERFEGRQVATYGVTAIPLLTACIQQSEGRYRGLLVRKERKGHGSRKLIEGRVDPHEPVIILDDSVSSGTTMNACCARLEEAGLRVEGGVCLVRFGWYGGFALMQERGYQMETVYDIWTDFMAHMEDETTPTPNPTKIFPELKWRQEAAPEGLHPAVLARRMMEAYLEDGALPRPPVHLDQDYDTSGGTWVSVRSRSNIHLRHARDGFWHFPEEVGDQNGQDHGLGHDLALAALKTASRLPAGDAGKAALAESAIAVTFFSRLETCSVGELDNDRYGIVVRSRERIGRMGGALPRMPGIVTPWQQFQHARIKNAELISFEPYELLRHEVTKVIEPGEAWQPTGVPKPSELPWHEDPAQAGRIATRARQLVLAALGLGAEPTAEADDLASASFAAAIDTLFVTVYLQGQLRGCMGTVIENLDVDLRKLVPLALADQRFSSPENTLKAEEVAVTVSLLYNRLELGDFSAQEVMQRVRFGEQALTVYQGQRIGTLLPFVAATHNLSPTAYALEVIDKAGITRPPYYWRRFDCVTWLADRLTDERQGTVRMLRGALPVEPPPATLEAQLGKLAALFTRYLLRHQREDGSLFFRYHPHQDVVYEGGDLPRIAHGAWVLCRAGAHFDHADLQAGGDKLLTRLLALRQEDEQGGLWLVDGKDRPSIAEVSFLLLALCAIPERAAEQEAAARRLATTLWAQIDDHGRITTHRDPEKNDGLYQDYFPGQALLALAVARRRGLWEIPDEAHLHRAFSVYRHRFHHQRHFGQVSWQMQAFAAWWGVLQEAALGSFVFEIADWLLGYQQAKGGGFLNDHQSDGPGYTTALYLEGLGAAVQLADAMGETARAERYRTAYGKGLAFVDGLVMQEHMAPLLPNPPWAIGGVRSSLMCDEVRIDFVHHALSAVLEVHPQGGAREKG